MFTDAKLAEIIVSDELTGEVLAVICNDGKIVNRGGVLVTENYGEPHGFKVVAE